MDLDSDSEDSDSEDSDLDSDREDTTTSLVKITKNLKWDVHIGDVIKRASGRLLMLGILKRFGLSIIRTWSQFMLVLYAPFWSMQCLFGIQV